MLIRPLVLTLLFAVSLPGSLLGQKKKIEKRDDLPRYTYKIDGKAVEFLASRDAVLRLAHDVKRDLEADLENFDISDNSTLQDFYADLGTIAMLEAQWDEYLDYLQKRRELEGKEATRLTMGMVGEAIAKAHRTGEGNVAQSVERNLREKVAGLPYPTVEAILKSNKGSAEIISENLVLGSIQSSLQPMLDQSGGEMSREVAAQLLGSAFTLELFLPVKDQVRKALEEVIVANQVQKEDIWAARNVDLSGAKSGQAVILAVWDSGVDTNIFSKTNQLWTNTKEIPANGKDDDGNGFVDDVNGIAYSLHSEKETALLFPIGELSADEDLLRRQMKGLMDIQSALDSPEASELKKTLSTLPQDQVKPFLESLNLYGNYVHGTHVAGIASDGNPFARILVARLTYDHRLIPEEPTIEQAEKDAAMLSESIDYFKRNGVRVVNMSWGGSVGAIESALEKNHAGGTPEERKALARKIFSIGDKAFREAIQGAPNILFVTSAGNSDNDVRFDEFYPSSYDYPNILSVGAVDQAGDETSFTSFGKVEVYANGFEVASFVPGGLKLKLNGTSMAAPQVMNLAGKLLATRADLTTEQLRQLILEGADEHREGDRAVRLLNPKRSLQLLERM